MTDPEQTCPQCEAHVPHGNFCGACGAHLDQPQEARGSRLHAFAAHPGQHVLAPHLVSTLFPHLPHRRTAPFRIAVGASVALLVILGLLRLSGPALAAAALCMPVLYLLYLYEVEIYEDEPVLILALTGGLGLLLGAGWAVFTGREVTASAVHNLLVGANSGNVIRDGVVIPLVAQVLMLVGPATVYFTGRYREALDGFSFGACAALGFTLSTTLDELWPQLVSGVTSSAPIVSSTLTTVERGLMVPFLNASTTGLIAGAIWLARSRTRSAAARGWTTSITASLLVAFLVRVFLGLVAVSTLGTNVTALLYALVAAVMLVWVRVALHHMLLAEAAEVMVGPEMVCAHCHHLVPRMMFCPHCGVAVRSTPKSGTGRLLRMVR